MRRAALSAAGLVLLVGPTVLAFFSGGYFDGPRAWAGVVAWSLVAVALLASPSGPPRHRGALLALGGLAAFAAWTLLSILWAPVAGLAYHSGQTVVLYVGALLAAAMLLRGRSLRLTEPALAVGTLVVIGYGLSERLLPGLLHFARSVSAEGRFEQPLTYWNASGELAALGFVLCARISGDVTRRAEMRAAAAAATAPLGLGLYLSFSRGALFACAAGLVTLVVAAPRREQLAAVLTSVLSGVLAALSAATLKGFTSLAGSLATREQQGSIVLALLFVIAGLAALSQYRRCRRGAEGDLRLPARAPLIAAGAITAGLALAIVVGAHESSGASPSLSGGATRLTSLQSNRYDYWSVAFRAFASQPLHGVGAGGWSVDWLRWRTVNEYAHDAHSLPLQTLAELGVVGLALLLTFLGGVALAARRALASTPVTAGSVAALATYAAHSPLDWDWQMPAVTLIAIALAGAVLAGATDAGVASPSPQSASAMRGASRRKIQTADPHTAT